jgi:hypothetical protein
MAEPAVTLNDIRASSLDETDAFRVVALRALEKKVLWLSTWMIHHANFTRELPLRSDQVPRQPLRRALY